MTLPRSSAIVRLRNVRRQIVAAAWKARRDRKSKSARSLYTGLMFSLTLLRAEEAKVLAVREWNAIVRYARSERRAA